ncbi:hypothetical protein L228DRAFT_260932 [Xylona heveae TC161]|uniref:Uncharacterized protein n=1 Tax=Xylona heveae (strain CBS 132557 / TC161) TaxID=1328760 RepID=A0A165GZK8_XYLHT|nr:hypothetical protein L228DRAFT_260932 [Xylona heveae TC161]KZF22800.1 hypothetical protein L228DRAFT_260932 [Xylona heveae TC161]
MSNQSPTHSSTTNNSAPSTPVPKHASLPDHLSSPSPAAAISGLQSARVEQAKHAPSHPNSSSMTPPPSSQIPHTGASTASPEPRAATPAMSLLSSPPMTAKLGPNLSNLSTQPVPTPEQIAVASTAELRSMVNDLSCNVREARMSEAHYKLQHSLLSIETSEAAKRMAVEHEMTRREMDVLQEQQRQASLHPPLEPHREAEIPPRSQREVELEAQCNLLRAENDALKKRLRHSKKLLLVKEDEQAFLLEENERLRNRIRENRAHLNQLRGPGGLYESAPSHPGYESPRHGSPHHGESGRPTHAPSNRVPGEEAANFAALLLADQVLSQENASAPTSPTRSRPSKQNPPGQSRGTHSVSSLPVTPRHSRMSVGKAGYAETGPALSANDRRHESNQHRRRESRDSTISASDMSDDGQDAYGAEEKPSHDPAKMPHTSLGHRAEALGVPPPSNRQPGLMQTKLFGQVRKPGVERRLTHSKRKIDDNHHEYDEEAAKRRRTEGVGLGIGGWSHSRH